MRRLHSQSQDNEYARYHGAFPLTAASYLPTGTSAHRPLPQCVDPFAHPSDTSAPVNVHAPGHLGKTSDAGGPLAPEIVLAPQANAPAPDSGGQGPHTTGRSVHSDDPVPSNGVLAVATGAPTAREVLMSSKVESRSSKESFEDLLRIEHLERLSSRSRTMAIPPSITARETSAGPG
jgi:hypothetical protein